MQIYSFNTAMRRAPILLIISLQALYFGHSRVKLTNVEHSKLDFVLLIWPIIYVLFKLQIGRILLLYYSHILILSWITLVHF